MKILRNLSLLIHSPKNFIFTVFSSGNKKITIEPYNPVTQTIVRTLVKQIDSLLPGHKINFFGSSALQIDGQRDIDIFVEVKPENFGFATGILMNQYGEPSRINRFQVEWRFEKKGFEVQLNIVDPNSRFFKDMSKSFKILSMPENKKEYQKLKNRLNGLSEKEYLLERMYFLNKITNAYENR